MSVALKKRAKAIRARYFADAGVKEAKHGEACRDRDTVAGVLQHECGAPAQVVVDGEGVCPRHWKRRCAPVRK